MLSSAQLRRLLENLGAWTPPAPRQEFVDGLDTELARKVRLAEVRRRRHPRWSRVARRALGWEDE